VLWVWGPVTMHSISMAGIDSANDGSGDIMDLVARMDAVEGCTALLLDSFMQGTIYKLFLQKWSMYGYFLHYARRLLDAIILGLLCYIGLSLKNDVRSQPELKWAAVVMLGLMAIVATEEALVIAMWVVNNRGEEGSKPTLGKLIQQLNNFCRLHSVHMLFVAYLYMTAAGFIILGGELIDPIDVFCRGESGEDLCMLSNGTNATSLAATSLAATARRQLKAGGSVTSNTGSGPSAIRGGLGYAAIPDSYVGDMYFLGDDELTGELAGVFWIMLSMGIFTYFYYFNLKLFMPFEAINIFQLSVFQVLRKDFTTFLSLFAMFISNFYFTLYFLYPRAGEVYLPFVKEYNSWYTALRTLLELGFTGSPPPINLEMTNWESLSSSQTVAMFMWLFMFLLYAIYSVILLLNLLIAMLSFTFDNVREQSTLECRTAFAQAIQRLELLASLLRMRTKVGELKGDQYTIEFRSVGESVETPQGEGSNDPFAPAAKSGDDQRGQAMRIESKCDGLQKQIDDLKRILTERLPAPPSSSHQMRTVTRQVRTMSQVVHRAAALVDGSMPATKDTFTERAHSQSARVHDALGHGCSRPMGDVASVLLFKSKLHLLMDRRKGGKQGEVGVSLGRRSSLPHSGSSSGSRVQGPGSSSSLPTRRITYDS